MVRTFSGIYVFYIYIACGYNQSSTYRRYFGYHCILKYMRCFINNCVYDCKTGAVQVR